MRILIDIGHPAHVHLFKHFAWGMQSKGHKVLFTCRDKEFETYLLTESGFKFKSFGKKHNSTIGKLLGMFKFDFKEFLTAIKFKPDIFLSHGSIYAAHAAFLYGKPHISLEDTFNMEQIRFYAPFTQAILTADYEHPLKTRKVIKYAGYHELAYLHTKRFTPDESVLSRLGIGENEKYVIIRFVSWKASHDLGHNGISPENKILAIKDFSKYAKVLITSESELPKELQPYKINIPAHRMHAALAFADLVWGESATMISEAAMHGTPGIYLDDAGRYYTNELEQKYDLCYNFTESEEDQLEAIEKGVELLRAKGIKEEWQKKRDAMLKDKIDVTAFLVWFIENWPESFRVMKEKPGYQDNFR